MPVLSASLSAFSMWCRRVAVLGATAAVTLVSIPAAQIELHAPARGAVYQRSQANTAPIPVAGVCSEAATQVQARALALDSSGESTEWTPLVIASSGRSFSGSLQLAAGWYQLEVREQLSAEQFEPTVTAGPVGVGEVFIVVGHSVAQGGEIDLTGASDPRARTIDLKSQAPETHTSYEKSADPGLLPGLSAVHFTSGVKPAPFGHGTYFWAKFADRVVADHGVPVLVLNAAFGGTSLEHWAKAARGHAFEHSFVNAGIGMPYVNLRNALRRYVSHLGVRAVLADHGQNDASEENEEVLVANYRAWIEQARRDLGFAKLAVVVNRQTPGGDRRKVRAAQERIIAEVPACFAGPDYDRLEEDDRYDGIHLSASGAEKAAAMWAQAVDAEFFAKAVPFLPVLSDAARKSD